MIFCTPSKWDMNFSASGILSQRLFINCSASQPPAFELHLWWSTWVQIYNMFSNSLLKSYLLSIGTWNKGLPQRQTSNWVLIARWVNRLLCAVARSTELTPDFQSNNWILWDCKLPDSAWRNETTESQGSILTLSFSIIKCTNQRGIKSEADLLSSNITIHSPCWANVENIIMNDSPWSLSRSVFGCSLIINDKLTIPKNMNINIPNQESWAKGRMNSLIFILLSWVSVRNIKQVL